MMAAARLIRSLCFFAASIAILLLSKRYVHLQEPGLPLKPSLIIYSHHSTSLGVAILKQSKRGTHAVVLPFDANVQISAYFAICCDVSSNPGPVERQTLLRTTTNNNTHSKRSSMIVHINTRSILKHMDELRLIFGDVYPSIIAITETWLDDSVADSEVSILNYSLGRLDRGTNRRGGGVAFYLLDDLKYIRRRDLEAESEAIWIQAKLCNTNFLIGCIYRAPNESLEVFNYMDDVLRYATQNSFEVIILGDLNCDCLNTSLQQTTRLQEFLMANELEQCNTQNKKSY